MPSPWNDTTDRQLLLTIIGLTAPQLPKWDQVATLMGEGFMAESVRQHFQKLRKEFKGVGEPGDARIEGLTKGTTTPRKPKAPADGMTPSKSTGKRKGKKATVAADGGDDEESPSKRVKAESMEADGF